MPIMLSDDDSRMQRFTRREAHGQPSSGAAPYGHGSCIVHVCPSPAPLGYSRYIQDDSDYFDSSDDDSSDDEQRLLPLPQELPHWVSKNRRSNTTRIPRLDLLRPIVKLGPSPTRTSPGSDTGKLEVLNAKTGLPEKIISVADMLRNAEQQRIAQSETPRYEEDNLALFDELLGYLGAYFGPEVVSCGKNKAKRQLQESFMRLNV